MVGPLGKHVERNPAGLGRSRTIGDALYVMFILLVIGAAVFVGFRAETFRLDQARAAAVNSAQRAASNVATELTWAMNHHALVAQAVAAVVRREPGVSQDAFENIVSDIMGDGDRTILNVALLEGATIVRVFPYKRNSKVLGTDLSYVHAQLPGLNLSRRNRRLSQTGPYKLIQGGKGLIYRSPVMLADPQTGNLHYWGSVGVVVSLDSLMALERITEAARGHRIALRSLDPAGQPRPTAFGDPDVFDSDPRQQIIHLPYGTWQIAAIPRGGWPTTPPYRLWIWSWVISISVIFIILAQYFRTMSLQRETARRYLEQAIEALRDGFVMYDANNRLVLCNSRYRELYGLPPEITRPGTPRDVVVRAILDQGLIASAKGREEAWLEQRMRDLDGSGKVAEGQLIDGRWVRASDARLPDGSVVGLRSDVTELNEARLRAEEASRAKSEFLSTMSHELRTPLTSIKGGLGLILSGKLDASEEQVKSLLQIAYQNCDRLTWIINDILDMQKIESGRMEYRLEPQSARNLVETAIAANRAYAQKFDVTYEFDAPENADATILVDRNRFLQIMDNLLSNAAKFSHTGGQVDVHLTSGDADCRVSVRDHGRGVASENYDKLFTAFSQIDSSDAREREGSGLGLAITKRLVEEMGGEIEFESTLGQGTEFFVIFPRADRDGSA